MKTTTRIAAIVLAVAGLGIFSAIPSIARPSTQPADSSTATGNCTISGTVTKDGKPLPNARVALFVRHAHVKTVKKGTDDSDNSATTQPSADEVKHKKHDLADATATSTADDNGKFTLTGVPAGNYVVVAGLKGDGKGHEHVEVTPGQSMSVEIPVSVPGEKTKGGKKLGKLGI